MSENEGKPSRVTLHKGTTFPTGDFSSDRADYTIEADVPESATIKDGAKSLAAIKDWMTSLEIIVDEKLKEKKKLAVMRVPTASTTKVPAATPQQPPAPPPLSALPWREYENNRGHWIFSNTPGAEKLLADLKAAKNSALTLEGYRYRIQGDGKFIARYPAGKRQSGNQ
jgi:hypothetical protein